MALVQEPARRPRVLMVVENAPLPGDARVWPESLALQEAGFEVEAIAPAEPKQKAGMPYEVQDGIAIFRFRPAPSDGSFAGYLREYAVASWRISQLARRRSRVRPFDVIHVANPPDVLLVALWPFKRNTRFVFDHHDLSPELYGVRFPQKRAVTFLLRLMERLSFALSDVVICTNESFRWRAIARGGVNPQRVFVVRNAPDPDALKPGAADPALKRGRRFLLTYVGLMELQDGVELALDALAALHPRRDDWHALFVGSSSELDALKRQAARLGLEEIVEFTGWVGDRDRIRTILGTSDVCLSPEPKNALNDASTLIKVAEYMSMARPIVAFDLTETRFTAADAAVYAVPNDPKSFAVEIDRLLDDPLRRARMGAVGRARILREFSWEHSRAALTGAYTYLLEDGGAPRRRRLLPRARRRPGSARPESAASRR
jgi:glycosyltransferase involved in cell wall biosynthesis